MAKRNNFRPKYNILNIPPSMAKEGVVILPLGEYKKLQEQAVPTYHLKGKAAERLNRLVEEGLKEYYEGKMIEASSLKEALKIYARQKKNKKH